MNRRRLPHLLLPNEWIFLTWHLAGSLPANRYPPPNVTNAGSAFIWMDRYLDEARIGPRYLAQPRLAELMVKEMRVLTDARACSLAAWCILPNHVHVLAKFTDRPGRVIQFLKGRTARLANLELGRTGGSFWQAESYDRVVRGQREGERIIAYIERNPVQAGLATRAELYPWSSASTDRDEIPLTPLGRFVAGVSERD